MYGLNKAQIIGRVGQDPELKYTGNSVPVCTFSVATDESYKDTNGVKVEKTEWHNVTAWRKLAELLAQYVKKGDRIYIEGKLETQTWEKDGTKHYKTQINASDFIFLNDKKGESKQEQAAPETPASAPANTSELPF